MNRYNVSKQLGDGSFGVVWLAEQKSTNEVVAIKKMKQRFASWEECLQLREIISLRRLQHPNIIKLKEVIRENTELSMVFEYMELNVYQIMRQRADAHGNTANLFNDKEIRSVMCQTLLGLQSVHKGGFMHRDLKPENLLTKGDLVKIADFGLAKEIRSRPPFTEYVSTRWYRAPEIVLRSTHYNSPIDVWALGVIFAELYLNRPLFPGASDTDQLFKICSVLGAPTLAEWDEGHQLARKMNVRFANVVPTPLRTLITNAPPAALDLLEAMLRWNPGERPSAAQCLAHPFFTGADMAGAYGGGAPTTASSSLFQGIHTGCAQNPFHQAQGVPPAAGGGPAGGPGNPGHTSGNSSSAGVGQYGQRQSPSPGGSPTPGQPGGGFNPNYRPAGGANANGGGGQFQGGNNTGGGYQPQGGNNNGGGGSYGGGQFQGGNNAGGGGGYQAQGGNNNGGGGYQPQGGGGGGGQFQGGQQQGGQFGGQNQNPSGGSPTVYGGGGAPGSQFPQGQGGQPQGGGYQANNASYNSQQNRAGYAGGGNGTAGGTGTGGGYQARSSTNGNNSMFDGQPAQIDEY